MHKRLLTLNFLWAFLLSFSMFGYFLFLLSIVFFYSKYWRIDSKERYSTYKVFIIVIFITCYVNLHGSYFFMKFCKWNIEIKQISYFFSVHGAGLLNCKNILQNFNDIIPNVAGLFISNMVSRYLRLLNF